ncbi:MAG: acyl-ACP thioesterase [Treponema sp.]|jgi:acyl-ACP thioesterase|nr:acyl-ACP thioesterase [Treponema sp.]
MEKLAVWTENCLVRFGAVDKSDSMTLDSIFNFFQEAAISHAENLGVGREAMAQTNQVWLLSRMSVQVDRRPKYGESVTIRTWPRGAEKLFARRDYDILGADGKAAVRASSSWIIVDITKRRPLRPHAVVDAMPRNEGLDALPGVAVNGGSEIGGGAIGLEENPSLQKCREHLPLYTDVDYNGHVNNISYIRWIEDAVKPELLEQARQMKLDINYMNEVLRNEITGIWAAPIETNPAAGGTPPPAQAFAFEGRKENQTAFRAELRLWQ